MKRIFITEAERKGSCYYEFQFCKCKNPVKNGKVADSYCFWVEDSLLVYADDFEEHFYPKCKSILDCALFPNGETGFYPYGVNYYSLDKTAKIRRGLEETFGNEYKELIQWLDVAIQQYNGFYILGL